MSAEAHSATETAKHMELGMRRLLKEFLQSEQQARASERQLAAKEAEAERGELLKASDIVHSLVRSIVPLARLALLTVWYIVDAVVYGRTPYGQTLRYAGVSRLWVAEKGLITPGM